MMSTNSRTGQPDDKMGVFAMLHCGIVGLPLSGKSTVFNVITRAGAEVKPYAGGKTDPNRAVVDVPDPRFDRLVSVHYSDRKSVV